MDFKTSNKTRGKSVKHGTFKISQPYLKCFGFLFYIISLSASSQNDPQPIPSKRFRGHFPGEALEERGQPLCV